MLTYTSHVREGLRGWGNEVRSQPMLLFLWLVWNRDVHCYDPEPKYGKTPCQQGFGACSITPKPSCGENSGTSGGRRIGYYQVRPVHLSWQDVQLTSTIRAGILVN